MATEDKQHIKWLEAQLDRLQRSLGPYKLVCEMLADRQCEYGTGADCNMLPQGICRSTCLPCIARKAIKLDQ